MQKQRLIVLSSALILLSSLAAQANVEAQAQKVSNSVNKQVLPLSQNSKKQYSETEVELIAIAEATLQAENDTLVTGDSALALKRNPRTQKTQQRRQEKFQKRLEKAKNRRSAMARAGQAYTSHQTKLEVKSIQFQGDTVILNATELAILPMSVDGKPIEDAYSYNQEHRFIFVKESTGWVLSSDERLNSNEDAAVETPTNNEHQDPALPPLLPPPSDPPSLPVAQTYFPRTQLVASASLRNLGIGSSKDDHETSSPTSENSELFRKKPTLLALAGVSKQEIVNYAHKHAGVYDSHCQCQRYYNSAYRSFDGVGGDCTNFISQALRQAGWQDVYNTPFDALSPASRANTSLWWYNTAAQSYTWVGAPQLFEFLKNHVSTNGIRRGTREFDLSKLEPGDLIQVDFAGDAYGITHTIIVTHKSPLSTKGVTGYNLLRVAYHSTDTLDRSFDDFYGANPGAVYYAWKISSSY